jgi:carboxypeptidase D
MLDEDDKEYYDVRGALVYDAAIGSYMPIQHNTPLVPFVVANNNILNLNSSYIAQLQELHSSCGYADYLQKYLQFPPPGIQPLGKCLSDNVISNCSSFAAKPSWSDGSCNLFVPVNTAAYQVNPCFSQYAINMQCPIPWDVISLPTAFPYTPAGATVYFDRADVKAAMHAPNITWSACSPGDVFIGNASGMSFNDESVDSIQHALPRVIEATNRVLVGNGDYDMQITTNGTLLAIQNMTWNGMLGFQSTPSTPVDIQVPELVYGGLLTDSGTGSIGGQGIMGIQHYERGLMWAQTFQATHMLPMSQPRSAYRHLQWLLGHTETL